MSKAQGKIKGTSKKQRKSALDTSPPIDQSDLVNQTAAARLRGVSRRTIVNRVLSGDLRSVMIDGKQYVFRREVLRLPLSARILARRRTDAELLDSVLIVADRLGRLPDRIEFERHGTVRVETLTKRFGTWKSVRGLAYLQGQPAWKDAQCLQCGRGFAMRTGKGKRTKAKYCSYFCRRDVERGVHRALFFNGLKYKIHTNGCYHSVHDPRLLHYTLWEFHHGKVPPHHRVCFIDGDKKNCCIENLYLKKLKPSPPCIEPGCPRKAKSHGGRCQPHLQQ